jgi:hypothetical protein
VGAQFIMKSYFESGLTANKMLVRIGFIALSLFTGHALAQKAIDKNFMLIDDFERHQRLFRSCTFDLPDHSLEGGEAVVFRSNQMQYSVVDIWLYSEMGKNHLMFWTENDWNEIMIVKRTNFQYDKPLSEKDHKVSEMTEYFSYDGKAVVKYNSNREKLNAPIDEQIIMQNERLLKSIRSKLGICK